MIVSEPLIWTIGLAMYANPFLLLIAWTLRFKSRREKSVRAKVDWFSLALASIGFLAFIAFIAFGPEKTTLAFDRWLRIWFRVLMVISCVTLVTGIAGKGKWQWVAPVSAVVTPLSCILQKVLE